MIVGSFQVTVPASARRVTVPPEFVASLGAGTHNYEVLAIEASRSRIDANEQSAGAFYRTRLRCTSAS